MIGESIGTRNVIPFPLPASTVKTVGRSGTTLSPPPQSARPSLASVGDAALDWIVRFVLVGLAHAAAAHGPVSPEMLDEVHGMGRRHRLR